MRNILREDSIGLSESLGVEDRDKGTEALIHCGWKYGSALWKNREIGTRT